MTDTAEPIVATIAGTYTCPDHPEVGPIAMGYYGDAPPAKVRITHNEEGNHHAIPVEDTAEQVAALQGESQYEQMQREAGK